MKPAVHSVGYAGELHSVFSFAQLYGLKILSIGKIQLKIQRLKVRAAQLRRHVLHHLVHILFQTLEQIYETAGLLLEVLQLFLYKKLNILVAELSQLLRPHGPKASQSLYFPRSVFQHIVHEAAYLRRAEAGRPVGLCLQTVLTEVGKLAAGKLVYSGGAEVQTLTVEFFHHGRGQAAAAQPCRRLKSRHALRLPLSEIFRRRLFPASSALYGRCRQTQGRLVQPPCAARTAPLSFLHSQIWPLPG